VIYLSITVTNTIVVVRLFIGILITRGRSMGEDFDLNDRARNWIRGIKKLYAGKPLVEAQREEAPAIGSFKIL